jgi:tRNA (guanine-N7-)-methyltransferase
VPDALAAWQPNVLDVGFGNGASVVHIATEYPEWRIVGVEMHDPGIVQLFDALDAAGLTNTRVMREDLLDVLPCVPNASLDRIQIFCPDPWPKVAQGHRRLIRPDVVEQLVGRLKIGGVLHLATDWGDYADIMRAACTRDDLAPVEPPSRASTKYEAKGRHEGRPMTDLAYARVE